MWRNDKDFYYLEEKSSVSLLKAILVKIFGIRIMAYDIENNIVTVVEMYRYGGESYITKEYSIKLDKRKNNEETTT